MSRDLYVYFTHLEYMRDFGQHPNFVPLHEYSYEEQQQRPQEELGKLKFITGQTIRIILDRGRNKACPWCGCSEPKIHYHEGEMPFQFKYYAVCPQCLAQGPTLNVSPSALTSDEELPSEYKELILCRWAHRKPKELPL